MKLHDRLQNDECIGKNITASPSPDNEWVVPTKDGDSEYYDVYDKKTGVIVYMNGESCTIIGFDDEKETVLLTNDDCDLYRIEISYKQYQADFGTAWAV